MNKPRRLYARARLIGLVCLMSSSTALLGAPVGCSSAKDTTAASPVVKWTLVGSYQDPRDPTTGAAFSFGLDSRYVLKRGSACKGTPASCVESGTFSLDTTHGSLELTSSTGAHQTLTFSLPPTSAALLSTRSLLGGSTHLTPRADSPTSADDAAIACLDPSDPTIASARSATLVRIADDGVALVGDGGSLLPGGDAGTELSGRSGLLCQKQIPLFTVGLLDSAGTLVAETPQRAIDFNLPSTCGGAVGPNCSKRTVLSFPIGDTCDQVGDDPTLVECDVSIGSLAHDSCCGLYPNGKYCGGSGPETADCTEAWNRAQSDYLTHNFWRKRFTAGVTVRPGWSSVSQANSEVTYWAPSRPDFTNDELCISNTTYQLANPLEASFCCNVPATYSGHCD